MYMFVPALIYFCCLCVSFFNFFAPMDSFSCFNCTSHAAWERVVADWFWCSFCLRKACLALNPLKYACILILASAVISSSAQTQTYSHGREVRSHPNCPIVAKNCVCEDAIEGGSNILCPDREHYDIHIHYKEPHQVFLKCNSRTRNGQPLHSTDVIYQLRNLTVSHVEWLQLVNCPIPTGSISAFMNAMSSSTGLKGLHIVYGRFDESNEALVGNQFLGLENLTNIRIERSRFTKIDKAAFHGLNNLQYLQVKNSKCSIT